MEYTFGEAIWRWESQYWHDFIDELGTTIVVVVADEFKGNIKSHYIDTGLSFRKFLYEQLSVEIGLIPQKTE